ncbi:MAG: cell division protein ZapE [Pelagibacteraceae bacterium]
MKLNNLKQSFVNYCKKNNFEENKNQIRIIEKLIKFFNPKKSIIDYIINSDQKSGFYLYGDVGVGKTMILDFYYNNLTTLKQRFHFNEFMIKFHDFKFKNKNQKKIIEKFVKNLKKKCNLLYLDEFQVTNIVDAMILGKLFDIIFKEKIKVIVTSNIKIEDLYKDGLQRDQFKPFIKIIKKNSYEETLNIEEDYRKQDFNKLERFFSLKKKDNIFKANRIFHDLTKGIKKQIKKIKVKSRIFMIREYYKGIAKFDFEDLCGKNVGAEDYIKISECCTFVLIENMPIFRNEHLNKKQRFITLIDIFYEKKIPLMITAFENLQNINTSSKLNDTFKRTISRIHELTSPNLKIN